MTSKYFARTALGAVLSISTAFHTAAWGAAPVVDGETAVAVMTTVANSIHERAGVLVSTMDLRRLDLREQKLSRELAETEAHLRIIGAMTSNSGSTYSLSKEFVFEHAPVLLSGCLVVQPFWRSYQRDSKVPSEVLDARAESGLCSLLDGAIVFVLTMVANAPGTASREAFAQAFLQRHEPKAAGKYGYMLEPTQYPKTARAFRIGAVTLGGLLVIQNALSWTYTDEINYRRSIDRLNAEGVVTEIQKQLETANAQNFELAAVRGARYTLLGQKP